MVIFLAINTWASKGPILGLMLVSESGSTIRLISIAFNAFSLALQVINVFVAFTKETLKQKTGIGTPTASPKYQKEAESPKKPNRSIDNKLRSDTFGGGINSQASLESSSEN